MLTALDAMREARAALSEPGGWWSAYVQGEKGVEALAARLDVMKRLEEMARADNGSRVGRRTRTEVLALLDRAIAEEEARLKQA